MKDFKADQGGELFQATMDPYEGAKDRIAELSIGLNPALKVIDEAVDQCIECGFCEISCLTEGLTLSARQRIVVQREIERLSRTGEDKQKMRNLVKGFKYEGEGS